MGTHYREVLQVTEKTHPETGSVKRLFGCESLNVASICKQSFHWGCKPEPQKILSH